MSLCLDSEMEQVWRLTLFRDDTRNLYRSDECTPIRLGGKTLISKQVLLTPMKAHKSYCVLMSIHGMNTPFLQIVTRLYIHDLVLWCATKMELFQSLCAWVGLSYKRYIYGTFIKLIMPFIKAITNCDLLIDTTSVFSRMFFICMLSNLWYLYTSINAF